MELFLLMAIFFGYVVFLFIITGEMLTRRIEQLERKRNNNKKRGDCTPLLSKTPIS